MPIYEYKCQNCEHNMEVIQKNNDALLQQCPECKQQTLRKLVSAASFKLTGTGWYETDFKHKKEPKQEQQSTADSKASKPETTKQTDTNTSQSNTKSESPSSSAKTATE